MANKKNTLKKQDLNRTTTHFPLKRGIKKKRNCPTMKQSPWLPSVLKHYPPVRRRESWGPKK